jgi:hypothetical protein
MEQILWHPDQQGCLQYWMLEVWRQDLTQPTSTNCTKTFEKIETLCSSQKTV